MKHLSALLIAIIGAVIGTVLWESSLLRPLRTGNPIDTSFTWLGATKPVLRVIFVGLVLWFVASVIYVWQQARRVRIHAASYDSNRVHKDVTEVVREEIEKIECAGFPSRTNFFVAIQIQDGEKF